MSWNTFPLRRIFRVVNGGTPVADDENWGDEVSWATPVDFPGRFGEIRSTRRKLTRRGALAGSRIVPAGSLLVSTRAPIGYVGLISEDMAFNQGCRALLRSEGANMRYFGYQLSGLTSTLQANGQGTTFLELSSDKLAETQVAVPPLEEQRRIADFLDAETTRIDKLMALREEMNFLLSQRRERIIDLEIGAAGGATADFAPLRYLIDRVGVGIVITPAAWYVDLPAIPAIRGVNVKAGKIDDEELVHISQEGNALHKKSQLESGDVVVVRTGQAGTAAVVPPELAGANCIDLVIVKPSERLVPRYLEYVLNSDYAKDFVVENSVGTIQSHFNVSAMKRIPVPSIPVPEQEAAVKRLDERIGAIDRLRASVARQRELLSERRQALITAAVTGEFDVSAASGRGIEE